MSVQQHDIKTPVALTQETFLLLLLIDMRVGVHRMTDIVPYIKKCHEVLKRNNNYLGCCTAADAQLIIWNGLAISQDQLLQGSIQLANV